MWVEKGKTARQLRELLRILERKLGIVNDSTQSCCGVTLAQCHTLVEIGRLKRVSLNQLASRLDLDKSTTSRTVDNLVRRGLVLRQTAADNRRSVVIKLTAGGTALFTDIETNMGRYFEQILASIPASKHQNVLESLKLLLDAIELADAPEKPEGICLPEEMEEM